MSLLQRIGVVTLAAVLGGCVLDGILGSTSTPISRDAAATQSCGPLDGPAISIYLAPVPVTSLPPKTPFIVVSVWALDELWHNRSWTITEDGDGGSVLYASVDAEWEFAERGVLTLTAGAPDSSMSGQLDVTFPNAGRARGEFDAVWTPQDPETFGCG